MVQLSCFASSVGLARGRSRTSEVREIRTLEHEPTDGDDRRCEWATKRSGGDVRRCSDKEETSCARRQVETRSRFSYLLHAIIGSCAALAKVVRGICNWKLEYKF